MSSSLRVVSPLAAGRSVLGRRARLVCTVVLIALTLQACTTGRTAYSYGRELIAQDNVEGGLAQLQQAMMQEPENLEYQKTYLQARERAIYNLLQQGDRQAVAGNAEEARVLYQRVVNIDRTNVRARDALQLLERNQKHRTLLAEGQAALARNDLNTAKERLSILARENPDGENTQLLRRAVADRTEALKGQDTLSIAYRKPITIEFKDAALRQIFDVISRSAGLNFIFDKEVQLDQRTSIFLRNSTIEAAMQYVFLTNQLESRTLDANTLLIYPNTAAKAKDYQELVIKSIFLGNAEAKVVANTLKTILKSRDIVVDDKLNMIILRDTPEVIRLAERLAALHDVPEPEVMLEVAVLEVSRSRLLELGVRWPGSVGLTPLSSTAGGTLTLNDLRRLSGSTIGVGVDATTINARQDDIDTNLLANPRIRARNHEKAKILIGQRLPNITSTATSTGFISESINYVDVGLKLDVEPTIYLDNDVAIKVALEVSSVNGQVKTQSGTTAYEIGTRTASTVLRLKDGENQILAGLINDEDRNTANKIPLLGEIPILGKLFGSQSNNKVKTEIVLSITPHLIRNIQRPDAANSEFKSGTDNSFRTRAESSAPAAANVAVAGRAPGGNPVLQDSSRAAPAERNDAARIHWRAPDSVKAGDTFVAQLMVESGQSINEMAMSIGFDSKALQVLSVTEGDFLKQGGAATGFSSEVDPNGTIGVSTARASKMDGATFAAPAVLVSFRALAATDLTQLKLLSFNAMGAGGQSVSDATTSALSIKITP
ncbi:secretin N-terminal domain-containing protein [Herbaspirillum sp. alder98]|uniref:secretin N-terminal domain-containing protein n=1 Tax=Herbaspirillum sp. alder98 TaxID=2913096 RepID=UPI001CD8B518|nr:secretin N-terminal domain-containing protein [Herbaspirillum sp. alder98]MCA1323585.1 general secretion pathway protein GspD [Herbaspirillum sp. alder98]